MENRAMDSKKNSKKDLLQVEQGNKLLGTDEQCERTPKLCCSKRLLIVFFMAIGYMSLISLRTNLSIAIVEMTSTKNTSSNLTNNKPEFDWNSKQRALALSGFSYGYMFAPLGGILASRFGGVTIFGIGTAVTAFTTLLTPLLVRFNFYLFLITRVIEGIFESFSMASTPEIWSRWAPPNERASLLGFAGLGFIFGSVLYFPINGFIARQWGWPYIFYVTGSIPLIWSIFWFLLIRNDPAEDKHISAEEREYLKTTLKRKLKDKVDYSLKSIFTSKPMWALWSLKVTTSFEYTFIYIYLPQYIKDIGHIDIRDIGFVTAIPHLCSFCFSPLINYLADYLRSNTKMSYTQVHKLFGSIGFFTISGLFVTITYTNFVGSIICTCLISIFENFIGVVIGVSLLDLAPRYASLLWGLNNIFFTTGAILAPTFIGHVVVTHSISEWNICFYTFTALYLCAICIYLKFGSGKLQPWGLHPDDKLEHFAVN